MLEAGSENLREIIRQEMINRNNLNPAVADALTDYWCEFSRRLFLESDEQKLLDDLRNFLVSLSEGTDSAEKQILRERKNRQRADARQQQLTIFRDQESSSPGY